MSFKLRLKPNFVKLKYILYMLSVEGKPGPYFTTGQLGQLPWGLREQGDRNSKDQTNISISGLKSVPKTKTKSSFFQIKNYSYQPLRLQINFLEKYSY